MAGQAFSGLSQASDTTIQNKPKLTLWVFFPKTWEHESFTCWPAGAMLGLYQCSAYTSLNQNQTRPEKMLELHHNEVEPTSWKTLVLRISDSFFSQEKIPLAFTYSWIRSDILMWGYSEKSVYSVKTDF